MKNVQSERFIADGHAKHVPLETNFRYIRHERPRRAGSGPEQVRHFGIRGSADRQILIAAKARRGSSSTRRSGSWLQPFWFLRYLDTWPPRHLVLFFALPGDPMASRMASRYWRAGQEFNVWIAFSSLVLRPIRGPATCGGRDDWFSRSCQPVDLPDLPDHRFRLLSLLGHSASNWLGRQRPGRRITLRGLAKS